MVPGFHAVDNGGDKGKGRGQKNRYLAPGDDLKHNGAKSGREQGHIEIQAR